MPNKDGLPTDMLATREEYGKILLELGEKDENIVALDSDLSGSTKTALFGQKYPDRFFNCGVAEQNMMGIAAGLAVSGKTVFASSFAIFATGRTWDQVRNSIVYPRLNVKIVASHGGVTVGPDGGSHQALEDIALMRVIPWMQVFVPADGLETRSVIRYAAAHKGPMYIRLGRPKASLTYHNEPEFQSGKSDILRVGDAVSLLACGLMVRVAQEAALILAERGISAEVVNMSSIKPIDHKLLINIAKQKRPIITIEEHSIIGGLGSAVAETVSGVCPALVKRIGIQDIFGESGSGDELMEKFGLTAKHVADTAVYLVKEKSSV